MIEYEIRVRAAVGQQTPVEKEELAEPGPLDPLEELLRDDLVGVHVHTTKRRDHTTVLYEGFHSNLYLSLLLEIIRSRLRIG